MGQWILFCMHFPLGRSPKDPRAVSATQSGSGSSTEKKYFYFFKARLGSHTSPKPVLSSAGAKLYSQTRAAIWVEPSKWKSLKISWTIPWKFRKILRRPKKSPHLTTKRPSLNSLITLLKKCVTLESWLIRTARVEKLLLKYIHNSQFTISEKYS